MSIGDYLDSYTYQKLLQDALSQIPNTVDKREGSIIYDAIAPACAVLAQAYIELKGILLETYILTASGEYLDLRVAEQGIHRNAATYAVRRGYFEGTDGQPKTIPIGSRFSTPESADSVRYAVTAEYTEDGQTTPGYYQLTCEVAGTVGNSYVGNILPITFIKNLAVARIDELLISGNDVETDEELRSRYQESVETKAFGGNVAQYREWVQPRDGVGAVQVYPVWNGGGTVKIAILGSNYLPASTTLIDEVQKYLDPENMDQGTGMGIAPIGHKVSVDTAGTETVKVEATVYLKNGTTQETTEAQIREAIEAHFLSVRKMWGSPDESNKHFQELYISQVNYAILSVVDVQNVTDITLNGQTGDLEFTQTALNHPVPIVGEVILHVK